ncbi:MAG: hypothetical protein WBB28_09480 [Crinalium sp.]
MSLQDTTTSSSSNSGFEVTLVLLVAVSIVSLLGFNHFTGLLEAKASEVEKLQSQVEKKQDEIEKLKQAEFECRSEFRGYRDGRR